MTRSHSEMEFLGFEARAAERDANEGDTADDFLKRLDAAYARVPFKALSSEELAARRAGRRIASANNAIEALPTTKADLLIDDLMDRHRIPTTLALQLLGETAREHPDAYARLIAHYG